MGKEHHSGVSTRQSTASTGPAVTTGMDQTTAIDLEGNEPIPGPSGLNSNDDHGTLLEELDALFSQRLSEYMHYEPVGATGDDYEEFEDVSLLLNLFRIVRPQNHKKSVLIWMKPFHR